MRFAITSTGDEAVDLAIYQFYGKAVDVGLSNRAPTVKTILAKPLYAIAAAPL